MAPVYCRTRDTQVTNELHKCITYTKGHTDHKIHTSCKAKLGVLTIQTSEARNSIFQAKFGKSNFAENGIAVEIHV